MSFFFMILLVVPNVFVHDLLRKRAQHFSEFERKIIKVRGNSARKFHLNEICTLLGIVFLFFTNSSFLFNLSSIIWRHSSSIFHTFPNYSDFFNNYSVIFIYPLFLLAQFRFIWIIFKSIWTIINPLNYLRLRCSVIFTIFPFCLRVLFS